MKYSPRHYAQAYLDLTANVAKSDLINLTKNFWQLVYKHKRFAWRHKIMKEVVNLWNERQGIKSVEVSLGRAVDDKQLQNLQAMLGKNFGKEVELKTSIKPHLLGGLVLQVDDTRLDASLKGRLDNLYNVLSGQNNK